MAFATHQQRWYRWYVLCTLLTVLTPVRLLRKTATEVRFKLPIQLRLHQHHPQGIEASAGCVVLTIAFSFGGKALILRRQPTHHVLKLYRVQGVRKLTLSEFYVTQACSTPAPHFTDSCVAASVGGTPSAIS